MAVPGMVSLPHRRGRVWVTQTLKNTLQNAAQPAVFSCHTRTFFLTQQFKDPGFIDFRSKLES